MQPSTTCAALAALLFFVVLIAAPPGQADAAVTPTAAVEATAAVARDTAPAAEYTWDRLHVGDVLAVGVPAGNASGERHCTVAHRIVISAHLPSDGAIGTGVGLSVKPVEGCRLVVASKTTIADGVETEVQDAPVLPDPLSPQMQATGSDGGGDVKVGHNDPPGPVNSCGSARTRAVLSDLEETLKGSWFKVTAKLRYAYDDCGVTVTGQDSYCTYDPAEGVLINCWYTTTVNYNPVSQETYGEYQESASGAVTHLRASADGYAGGDGSCRWEMETQWTDVDGNNIDGHWEHTQHCYYIDPSSV